MLDEALPTTIAEGRASFAKYPEAAKIFLPGGKVPKPGDRFVNKDYAETLRTLAKEGGAVVLSRHRSRAGSPTTWPRTAASSPLEDLAQYRAMERKPLVGQYRGHLVYSVPPPVSTGAQIVETLQILDNYVPKPGATLHDRRRLPALRRSKRGACATAAQRIADPERWPVDLGNHLDAGARARTVQADRSEEGVRAGGGGRGGGSAGGRMADAPVVGRRRPRPTRADRHDRVRRRGRRRQHDRVHADALDLGRQLLRLEGARLPLQRSLPRRRRARRRLRQRCCR